MIQNITNSNRTEHHAARFNSELARQASIFKSPIGRAGSGHQPPDDCSLQSAHTAEGPQNDAVLKVCTASPRSTRHSSAQSQSWA
eukprot:5163701-Prymnesium_polylepis.1